MSYRKLSVAPGGTKINRKPGMGGRNLSEDTYAWNYDLPCKNPNCKSHGKPHPNCQCYGGGGEGDYAKGGEVHFCSTGMPHKPSCAYYAHGAKVDHHTMLGHAAVEHGLLGMMKHAGSAKMADPEKHVKTLDKVRGHLSEGNHEKATDMLHEHPLAGGMGKKHLTELIPHIQDAMVNNEPNPEALKGSLEYLHSAIKGHAALDTHTKAMMGPKAMDVEADHDLRSALDSHLKALNANPEAMLDAASSLGHYMPEHSTQIAAMTATAVQYFDSIRPKPVQLGSLDTVAPPDKAAQSAYDRQLDIAEQPLLVLRHVKDGTLLPQDIETVKTLYPGLYGSMVSKAGEALIDSKGKKTQIPYKQRLTLSMLLDEPLDFTMTPGAMQAVMTSQGAQQAQQQQKGPKKATGVELKQINKVNEMGETKLEKRQTQER